MIAVLGMPLLAQAQTGEPEPAHGVAMYGKPALPAGFSHLPYANPDAPKGGRVIYAAPGTFNTISPFTISGTPALGVWGSMALSGTVIESLMARSYDEPFTLYGLIAESIRMPEDRSWVEFRVDPQARFSDGRPVTAEDVVFSWELLRDRGRPNHRDYYSKVARAEITDARTVRFDLTGADNFELPLILGLMPVLPRHAIDPETFQDWSFAPMIGSGPYVVADVQPGRSLTLKRNPGYWAANKPVMRGLHNFDEIHIDYYRDGNTMFEAFRRHLYDLRIEADATRWTTGYDFPAVRDGQVVLDTFRTETPKPMHAFVFNTRRAPFRDVRVREALGYLFDFEWVNANLFGNVFARTASYYHGSELSALGRPASEREQELLAPYRDEVRADIMDGTWRVPQSDGSGRDRTMLRKALGLLRDAGWTLSGGALRNADGQQMSFEILIRSKDQERVALAYVSALQRAGINATVRLADATQFEQRLLGYEFDMTVYSWSSSLSPGNEQRLYWGSGGAENPGTRNYMGVNSKGVDAMIGAIVDARTREDLVAATRALDRLLLSGFYVVPLYHAPEVWIARWKRIGMPEKASLFGPLSETWWQEAAP